MHSHGPQEAAPLTPEQAEHHRRALRILVAVLIPLAVWTVIGLVLLWPSGEKATLDQTGASSQEVRSVSATINRVQERGCQGQPGSVAGDTSVCATLTVTVDEGPSKGKLVDVDLNAALYRAGAHIGQKVVLYEGTPGGQTVFQFHDFERKVPLLAFGLVFAVLVVLVARLRGFLSLVGLGFAFLVLSQFMMPALLEGRDPLLVGVVGSATIMFVVLYCSHGFTLRTTTALVGTLFGLGLTAGLGTLAVNWAHLTGVSSEDDFVLSASAPAMPLTAVVLCGLIVACLGALNDVTITQASAVWELADSQTSKRKLFSQAMRIGRDHIASTVYTIAFAAAGAALPTLLLLSIYQRPLMETLTGEIFGGEFIRTAIGSIGLVLAVPVTTAVGVAVVTLGRPSAARARGGRGGRIAAAVAPRGRRSLGPSPADSDSPKGAATDETGAAPSPASPSASTASASGPAASAPSAPEAPPRRGRSTDDFRRPTEGG